MSSSLFTKLSTLGVMAMIPTLVFASSALPGKTDPKTIEKQLSSGNARFISSKPTAKNFIISRKPLINSQSPVATVITCSDSRVAPELVFDQDLGRLFVVRVAGNVIDASTLGSIEYGVNHLRTPLLIILGHQSCGAVSAAIEYKLNNQRFEDNINAILEKMLPAVSRAQLKAQSNSNLTNVAIQENIRQTYLDIMAKSPTLKKQIEDKKVKVILAEYYLDSGKVVPVSLN